MADYYTHPKAGKFLNREQALVERARLMEDKVWFDAWQAKDPGAEAWWQQVTRSCTGDEIHAPGLPEGGGWTRSKEGRAIAPTSSEEPV